jgi:hypothetical protein
MRSDRAFKAQLVTRDQRDLFEYWRSIAGPREMPARSDINPGQLQRILPFIGLIDVSRDFAESRYRLAGTRLRDVYGAEITGIRVAELLGGRQADYWERIYERIVIRRLPAHGVVRGPVDGREHVILFWLRLPLSQTGSRVDKILCYDLAAPCPSPYVAESPRLMQTAAHAVAARGLCFA